MSYMLILGNIKNDIFTSKLIKNDHFHQNEYFIKNTVLVKTNKSH